MRGFNRDQRHVKATLSVIHCPYSSFGQSVNNICFCVLKMFCSAQRNLREAVLFCFNVKKRAVDCHRGSGIILHLSKQSKSGSDDSMMVEVEEEDPRQMLHKLAAAVCVEFSTVAKRFKPMNDHFYSTKKKTHIFSFARCSTILQEKQRSTRKL